MRWHATTSLVVLAAACWGLSGGIAGMLIAGGWSAFTLSFYRGTIGLVFVLAWLVLRPRGSGLASHRLWFWSTVAGLGVAGNFAFYAVSIAKGSVAIAATLMYCAPVFVYLASFLLRLERPTAMKWGSLPVVMLGIVLLTQVYDIGASVVTPVGLGAGLLAGLCYAVFIFGLKYAARHGSPQAALSIAFALLAIVLVWPADGEQIVTAPRSPDWPLFAALGVLGAGLSFILYMVGLKQTAPAVASIIAMVEPVTASLFSVAILGESLTAVQLAGMALILLTVTALSVASGPDRARA